MVQESENASDFRPLMHMGTSFFSLAIIIVGKISFYYGYQGNPL